MHHAIAGGTALTSLRNVPEPFVGVRRIVHSRRAVKAVIDQARPSSGPGGGWHDGGVGGDAGDAEARQQSIAFGREPAHMPWFAGDFAVVLASQPSEERLGNPGIEAKTRGNCTSMGPRLDSSSAVSFRNCLSVSAVLTSRHSCVITFGNLRANMKSAGVSLAQRRYVAARCER